MLTALATLPAHDMALNGRGTPDMAFPGDWVFVFGVLLLIVLIFARVYGGGNRAGGRAGHRSRGRAVHQSERRTGHPSAEHRPPEHRSAGHSSEKENGHRSG